MNPRVKADDRLRVALVACSLGLAGAEKQTYYISKALLRRGVDVRIYCMMRGGKYQEALRHEGIDANWIGWIPTPPLRAGLLVSRLLPFRPHVIQSVNAHLNGYCAVAGRFLNAISVGGLRSDVQSFLKDNPRFAKPLLSWPDGVAVNSRNAIEQVEAKGLVDPKRLYLLPNAIDASEFPERPPSRSSDDCNCLWVGRLFPAKRADLFLRALAAARAMDPRVRGTLIGYGPEYPRVEQLAEALGLFPDGLQFLGFREDVADVLQQADVLVFSSESEGMPNVILEAMAASIPVIATPAGDAADLVQGSGSGYVVPFGSVDAMASAMVRLARSSSTRLRLGAAARQFVVQNHSLSSLSSRLLRMYGEVSRASVRGRQHSLLSELQADAEIELETSRW